MPLSALKMAVTMTRLGVLRGATHVRKGGNKVKSERHGFRKIVRCAKQAHEASGGPVHRSCTVIRIEQGM